LAIKHYYNEQLSFSVNEGRLFTLVHPLGNLYRMYRQMEQHWKGVMQRLFDERYGQWKRAGMAELQVELRVTTEDRISPLPTLLSS
jgi:uncharacterized protein YukE